MNIEAFHELIDALAKQPVIHMRNWFLKIEHPCGATACMAGTACFMRGWVPVFEGEAYTARIKHKETGKISIASTIAMEILGITSAEASRLFYADRWPADMERRYWRIKDPEEERDLVIQRVRHFMETGQ